MIGIMGLPEATGNSQGRMAGLARAALSVSHITRIVTRASFTMATRHSYAELNGMLRRTIFLDPRAHVR